MDTNDLDLLFTQTQPAGGGAVEFVFGDDAAGPDVPVGPDVNLVFRESSAHDGLPLELVFDDSEDAPEPEIPDVTVEAAGRITGIRSPLLIRTVVLVQSASVITGLRQAVCVAYNVNASRPAVVQAAIIYHRARATQTGVAERYQQAQPATTGARAHWQRAQKVQATLRSAWQESERLATWARGVYQQAVAVPSLPLHQRWQESARLRTSAATGFEEAVRLPTFGTRQHYQETLHLRTAAVQHWQTAVPAGAHLQHWAGYGLPTRVALGARYQEAWPPRPGARPRPVVPVEPCYLPTLPAHLVFDAALDSTDGLLFVCERHGPPPGPDPEPVETVVIPVRRTYIVINNITLHRVDTGAELYAYSFNMSLDYQSWTWSWNASLHNDCAADLGRDSSGDPAELAVFVNGVEFRLRLEGRSRDRRFSPTRWAVSGKGKASVLGAADVPKQSFKNLADRTAQQLVADVLTINGVPMGWAVDWDLDDWLVPAGAWAIQGNYIDAINDIAGAAGGYVQPHNTAATLCVLPRYPLAPWHWGSVTPDFEIPADAAEVEGTDFIDKPEYNRVFLGGIGAGVFGPFTRTGTAGNVIAPQVNHALITHADAHRQRGIAELSDTGKQERVTLNMQVLPETGVIVPGKFVRYLGDVTVMGIVRSTAIDWSRPRLRQTLEIETHA